MPQRRKTRSSTLPVIGGNFRGVIITDPDGHLKSVPFSGNSGDVLSGEGRFVPGGAGSAVWGSITGTLSNQADLQAALDAKQDLLVWDEVLGVYLINR